jgi:hypothetical protein
MINEKLSNEAENPALNKGAVSTRLSIGSTVETPHGAGVIVAEEVFRTCERWGVRLHRSPFTFSVAFYFKNEIQRAIEVNSLSK